MKGRAHFQRHICLIGLFTSAFHLLSFTHASSNASRCVDGGNKPQSLRPWVVSLFHVALFGSTRFHRSESGRNTVILKHCFWNKCPSWIQPERKNTCKSKAHWCIRNNICRITVTANDLGDVLMPPAESPTAIFLLPFKNATSNSSEHWRNFTRHKVAHFHQRKTALSHEKELEGNVRSWSPSRSVTVQNKWNWSRWNLI